MYNLQQPVSYQILIDTRDMRFGRLTQKLDNFFFFIYLIGNLLKVITNCIILNPFLRRKKLKIISLNLIELITTLTFSFTI